LEKIRNLLPIRETLLMFMINLNIKNPYSDRFFYIKSKNGKVTKNKSWEFQINKTNDLIKFEINFTTRQSHSGLFVSLALFGYELLVDIHDNRHWDYFTNNWEIYKEED
jgi:hypothetical protein